MEARRKDKQRAGREEAKGRSRGGPTIWGPTEAKAPVRRRQIMRSAINQMRVPPLFYQEHELQSDITEQSKTSRKCARASKPMVSEATVGTHATQRKCGVLLEELPPSFHTDRCRCRSCE